MRFQVPQFIEVEDKIFGPLTFKQFVYLAGAGGITVASWTFLPKFFAIIISVPFLVLGVSLAFYKVNNRPFIFVAESFFRYITKSKLYIWKKEDRKGTPGGSTGEPPVQVALPKLSDSKLKDLSWSLDVTKAQGVSDEPDGE